MARNQLYAKSAPGLAEDGSRATRREGGAGPGADSWREQPLRPVIPISLVKRRSVKLAMFGPAIAQRTERRHHGNWPVRGRAPGTARKSCLSANGNPVLARMLTLAPMGVRPTRISVNLGT